MTMERPVRDFEWELWKQYLTKGYTILELGNKKNSVGVYKPWLQRQGYRHVGIDINGLDGALPLDLRVPVQGLLATHGLPLCYDVLTNSGTIEHVIPRQDMAWRNAFELTKVGGVQIHVTPAADHWMAHGLYHPTEEFFLRMARDNNMEVLHLDTYRWTPHKVLTRCVLRKTRDVEFIYPGDEYLCKTPDCITLEAMLARGEDIEPLLRKET